MPCYHPLIGYRSRQGRSATGRWPLVFNRANGYIDMEVKVPCGRCIGCRLDRSRQWAVRCIHEATFHTENCFLTLTYKDNPFSLNKQEFPRFIKKLRKSLPSGKRIKFFHCGEYGHNLGRPHHHCCIFGFYPTDCFFYKRRGDFNLYISPSLENLWGNGYVVVGAVTMESAAYVARYITKKVTGEMAPYYYDGREPEYLTMSRGNRMTGSNGIGQDWFTKYKGDVTSLDKIIMDGGQRIRVPRYYDKLIEKVNPEQIERIKRKRVKRIKNYDSFDLGRKEEHKLEITKRLQRSFENANS